MKLRYWGVVTDVSTDSKGLTLKRTKVEAR